jgi:hypothetical protein
MSENRREGQVDEEDDFHPIYDKIWYIKQLRDGKIKGKIQLKSGDVDQLEIVPASIFEPDEPTQEQIQEKVSPRKITIQATNLKALSGKQEKPPHVKFDHRINIQGIDCSVFILTQEEFGEVIWARQPGYIVCCKWQNLYYKGGKERGSYCTITHLVEEDPLETLPNWKFYCVGQEIKSGNIETYDGFGTISERDRRIYRITKIEIPPPEEGKDIVKRIKQRQTVQQLV